MDTLFNQTSNFFVGANYWASHAGTFMWRNWNAEQVEKDFQILHTNGVEVLRVFPLWCDFQKLTDHRQYAGNHVEYRYNEEPLGDSMVGQAAMDPEMLERFHIFCQLANKYQIKLIVGLLTGWMSGRLYVPIALEHRNLINDPEAIRWEILFVKTFVHELKNESAIIAWDWGNECNCLSTHTLTEMWLWGNIITSTIRLEDNIRPIISGLHGSNPDDIKNMGEVADILTTHPYPLFTPHCDVDYLDSYRSAFHAACQTRFVSDIGRKPAFAEEIGSFGPTISSDKCSALYARNSAWNSFAHNCYGFLWWCAHDQTELLHTPYDWNSMERELGLIKVDGTPKETIKELQALSKIVHQHPLTKHRTNAIALKTNSNDPWGIAFMTFMLAKKANFDISFHDAKTTIPKSDVYLLPSISGTTIIPRHQYYELLRRVKEEGATLYISSGYSGLQPFDNFGFEIDSIAKADCPGRIISKEYNLDLKVERTYSIRPGKVTAKVLACDENNNPVFTVSQYGKGKLIFLAMPLEYSLVEAKRAFQENAPNYANVYKVIAEISNINRVVYCDDSMISLTEHPCKNGNIDIVAVNNSNDDKIVDISWNEKFVAIDCINGQLTGSKLTIANHSGAIITLKQK